MKVLFIFGGKTSALHEENDKDGISFYIQEQADGLRNLGVEIDYFRFNLSSKRNIYRRIKALNKVLAKNNYDLIHAHYGLFGFLSIFAKGKTPLITTFHGSDVNIKKNRMFSALAIKFSSASIFVSRELYDKALLKPKKNYEILPCAVDQSIFYPIEKSKARKILGYKNDMVYILFPSIKSNPIKNYPLAKRALELLNFDYELIELVKKSRDEVNLIMNACDLLILTSKSEGSPQVIKEALSTNLPLVSVDVGDVLENIKDVNNCFITSNDPNNICSKIKLIISNNKRTNGRSKATQFESNIITKNLLEIYKKVIFS